MSSFTKASFMPLCVVDPKTGIAAQKKREGRGLYTVHGDGGDGFRFHIGFEGSGMMIHVPEGFVTDGPSIPRLIGWAVPQGAKEHAMKSAAVHDLLCEHPAFSRPEADANFLVAMYAEETPPMWREIFFNAVRTNSSKRIAEENAQLDLFKPPVTGPILERVHQ